MTSKQRSYLAGKANTLNPVFNVGKSSLTPEFIDAIDDVLEKRELIKISVLNNCLDDPKSIAEVLSERTRSEVVRVIGKKIILFRQNKKESNFDLPK